MEKIKSIKEIVTGDKYDAMTGFCIETDLGNDIQLLISDYQSCCEDRGYMVSEDDTNNFIGAEILAVKVVEEEDGTGAIGLNEVELKGQHEYGFDGGGIIFVNVETNKGTLQFGVYNGHNGCYGHSVTIKTLTEKIETGL